MKHYGLTQADIRHYHWLLSLGRPHDYLMVHLAQTYRTRKANKERRERAKWIARRRKEREREREQYHVDALKADLASVEERYRLKARFAVANWTGPSDTAGQATTNRQLPSG